MIQLIECQRFLPRSVRFGAQKVKLFMRTIDAKRAHNVASKVRFFAANAIFTDLSVIFVGILGNRKYICGLYTY